MELKPDYLCPPGYKQTEVGVIPEEWETRPCSDLSDRIMVGIVIRPTQYYVGQGVPAFRSTNIREDGINDSDLVFISEKSNALLAKSQTRVGDVLTVRTGYPGTSAVVLPTFAGCNCIDILITRPSKELNSKYLAVWVNSSFGKKQVLRNQGGLAQQHFNVGDMRNLVIALPPLPEQRAIAGVLTDVDELIGALEHLIAKKRNLKQATMQQLLTGQKRLPGFHGEWEVRSLHEVCQKIQDGTHFSPKLGGNDYLYVTSKNIGFGKFDVSTADRIDAVEHAKIYARCDVKKGDLLLTKDGANTGNAALNPLDEPFSLLSSVALLRFDCRRHFPAYFLYQILSFDGQRQIKDLMSGNAITRVTLVKIRSLRFSVASLEEQTAIAEVLSDMDAELAALMQRRDKTRALKQGMMQELLTGKTRLVESGKFRVESGERRTS